MGVKVIDARGSLEDLHNRFFAVYLENLTLADSAVTEYYIHNLGVLRELHVVEDH